MNDDINCLIASLSPEIDKKCSELHKAHNEKIQTTVFMLLCAAAILVPTLFVFFGFSLITLIIPVMFVTAAFLVLSPILFTQQGGQNYE